MQAKLTIIQGPFKGREINLGTKGCSIGRASSNTFVIPDITVSREHATLVLKGNEFIIIDKGLNGVRVNGALETSRQLKNFDVIEIGPCAFQYSGNTGEDDDSFKDNRRTHEKTVLRDPEKTLVH